MSELQPWQNPPKASPLPAPQPVLPMQWLRAWWPAIVWAALIFSLSTDSFSTEHTASILEPILRWIMPSMTAGQFETIHHFIRKSAHFTEYFIFCLLLYRGLRRGRRGWRWTWGLTALFCAAAYSVLDEIHQAFTETRTASADDSLLDSAGALAAFAAIWLWFGWRRSAREAEIAPNKAPSV